MPRLKILFFSHSSFLFGAENCLLSLATSLDRERFEAVVIIPADGALKQKLDEAGIRSHIFPAEWWVKNEGRFLHPQNQLVQRVDQLLRIVAEERPDVIHSNTSVTWMGAFVASMLGIRHIWHLHEMLVDHPSLEPMFPLPLLYQSIDFLSDRVVTVSEDLRRELSGYVPSEKVRVVYNGVPAVRVDSESAAATRATLDASGRTIALTVTSLQKYKGIDYLVSAAADVIKQKEDVLFLIAGTGPREAVTELMQRVTELGLEDSVRYLGFRDDVPNLLAACDLFVLPSLKEAFPLVVLEAMAQGKAVVATDCGGTAEMVVNGKTGYLVPTGDHAALAGKILDLADDAAKRAALGEAGAKTFLESFTEDRYVRSFEDLYADVAAAPKPALQTRERSTLNALLAGYEGYIRAIRSLPEKELALQTLKQQNAEMQALLAARQSRIAELEKSEMQQAEELQKIMKELMGLAALTPQQAQELEQKTAELEEYEALTLQLANELQQKTDKSVELETLRLELVARLQAKRTKLEEMEALRQQLVERLDEKRAQLEEREALRLQLVDELQHTMGELETLRTRLTEELQQKDVELEQRDALITRLKVAVVDRDRRLADLAEELLYAAELRGELENWLDTKAADIATREDRLKQVRMEMDQAAEQRAELDRRLRQKAMALADRDERLRFAADEIAREAKLVDEKLRQKDQELTRLSALRESEKQNHERELERLAEDNERLKQDSRQRLREEEQRLQEKEQRIDDLLNSISWKLTAPLRSLYDLVRGRG